jgi:NitT/TauT family transport system substrate-binding protein
MLAAREFGDADYAKLDPLTVGMPYPEAMAALVSRKTEITAHVASPPFAFLELDHPGIHRVVNSVEALGPLPVIMTHATRAFHDANPALVGAFIAALDQACELIAREPATAAQIYAGLSAVKIPDDQVRRILADQDTHYGSTPVGVMQIAGFMHRVGTLKNRPGDWKELFVPEMHGRNGS